MSVKPKSIIVYFGLFLFIVVFLNSCTNSEKFKESKETGEYQAGYVYDYYKVLCKMLKETPGFFPPQASRVYGYAGISNYESVVHGIKGGVSLHPQLNDFGFVNIEKPEEGKVYNWAVSSNAALAAIIRHMFEKSLSAAHSSILDSMEFTNHSLLSFGDDAEVAQRSKEFGYAIANAVFEYSKTDGGHESYLDAFQLPFTPPTDEYCWIPTSSVTTPLSPKWGNNRPFLKENITKTHPGGPVPFSSEVNSEFYKEALAVYNQWKENTPEEIEIAKYWADDPVKTCTPPGHTVNILTQILEEERVSLAKASVGFARMGIAENDAFIACWKAKYEYFLLRPVTYIQRYIDPSFTTVIGTPPFPTYTSGHSCEIGSGARVLSDLFTDGSGDYQFTDYSQLQFGLTARSYSNFEEMALECANSRLYGGIHYPMDNFKGLQTGKAIGDNVNKRIIWPHFIR